jgi:thioredoxin 1
MDYQKLALMVVVIMVAYLVIQGPVLLRARKVKGKALDGLAAALPAGADPSARYLLYFWSPSCGMCRSTTPVINQLQQERSDVVSLNAMEHMPLAQQAGVMGTPAFVVVDKGAIEQLAMGARSRRQMEAMLAKH